MERTNNMETKTSLLERLSANAVNFGLGSLTFGLGAQYHSFISRGTTMEITDIQNPIYGGLSLIALGLVSGVLSSTRNGGTYN